MKKGIRQFEFRYDNKKQGKALNLLFACFYFFFAFFTIRVVFTIPFSTLINENPNFILTLVSVAVGLIISIPNAFKKKRITVFNDFIELRNFTILSQKIKYNQINEIKILEKGKLPLKDRIYGVGDNQIVITYKGNKKAILAIEDTDLFISIIKKKNNDIVFLIPNDNNHNYLGTIGKKVKVIVDRPVGTYHPEHKDIFYFVNYGYIPDIIAGDGEEQDAYILGINVPLDEFEGAVCAVIHRKNDSEDKYVVAPDGISFSKEEIREQTKFQEKYFDIEIIC